MFEKKLDGDSLIKAVSTLIENDTARYEMENRVREFAVTDALDRISDIVKTLVK